VNNAKFASITSELVVRKGEARPWPQRDAPVRSPQMIATSDEEDPLEADDPHPQAAAAQDGTRRCTLRLTPCEYERLGIVAVKRNTSRQQILRLAIEEYLTAVEREYGRDCGCLGGRTCQNEKPRMAGGPRSF
jgi:hypothetical protein